MEGFTVLPNSLMGMLLGMGANVAVEQCSLTVVVERREMSAIGGGLVTSESIIARHNLQIHKCVLNFTRLRACARAFSQRKFRSLRLAVTRILGCITNRASETTTRTCTRIELSLYSYTN